MCGVPLLAAQQRCGACGLVSAFLWGQRARAAYINAYLLTYLLTWLVTLMHAPLDY